MPAALALVAAACAAGGGAASPAPDADPAPTAAATAGPGPFRTEPLLDLDLQVDADRWVLAPGVEVVPGQGLAVTATRPGSLVAAPAPVEVRPGSSAVLIEADLDLPRAPGSGAGVWCRSDPDQPLRQGYAFVVGRDGGWGLFRYKDGRPVKIERGELDPAVLASGTLKVRLACGASSGGRITLGVAYDKDVPLLVLIDDDAQPTGPRTTAGVLASAGEAEERALVRRFTLHTEAD